MREALITNLLETHLAWNLALMAVLIYTLFKIFKPWEKLRNCFKASAFCAFFAGISGLALALFGYCSYETVGFFLVFGAIFWWFSK